MAIWVGQKPVLRHTHLTHRRQGQVTAARGDDGASSSSFVLRWRWMNLESNSRVMWRSPVFSWFHDKNLGNHGIYTFAIPKLEVFFSRKHLKNHGVYMHSLNLPYFSRKIYCSYYLPFFQSSPATCGWSQLVGGNHIISQFYVEYGL